MNLQKLDKKQTLRKIDLKNEYKAYLWKKNKSQVKFIESLSNQIYENGLKFIVLWENLDFFLSVRDKYDDTDDAKNFIESCLAELEEEIYSPNIYFLHNYSEISKITSIAIKGEDSSINSLTCRYIIYSSAYDLLFEIVAKSLSGYTFSVAYYEIVNKIFPEEVDDIYEAHKHFAEFFAFEREKEYEFTPYKLYSTNEYILNYDISALVGIVCEITDANIIIHELVVASREGKIFEEPKSEFTAPAMLYEFEENPYLLYKNMRMEVAKNDLGKDIFVCSIFLDLYDGVIRTISGDEEISSEDVANCIRNLLKKSVYVHPEAKTLLGHQIEISWVEAM